MDTEKTLVIGQIVSDTYQNKGSNRQGISDQDNIIGSDNMQATVKRIINGRLEVRVRRSFREEIIIIGKNDVSDVTVGSRIEVTRRVNNPYLQFVRLITQ